MHLSLLSYCKSVSELILPRSTLFWVVSVPPALQQRPTCPSWWVNWHEINQNTHFFLRCLRHVWALRIDSIHISHLKRPFILYLCSHIDEHASWIKYLNKLCIHFIVSCDGGFSSDQYESANYDSVATGRIYTSLSCRWNCEVNRLAGFVRGGLERVSAF